MIKIVFAFALVLMVGCGEDDPCADPTLCGEICVTSNIEAPITIRHNLTGRIRHEISIPEVPEKLNNCFMLRAGSYTVTYGEVVGYKKPPPSEVHVREGDPFAVHADFRPKPK